MVKQKKNDRIYYLDFIRVIATFLVILYHFLSAVETYGLLHNPDAFCVGDISLLHLGGINITLGNYAVSLFLIVTGAGLMSAYPEAFDVKDFYKRRARTIYPVYYLSFIVAFLFNIVLKHGMEHGAPVWSFLLTVFGVDGWLREVIPNYALVGDEFIGCILGIYILFPLLHKAVNKNPHITVAVYTLSFLILEYLYPFAFTKRNDVLLRAFEVLLGMYFVKLNRKVTWKGFGVSIFLLGIILAVRMPWISAYVLTPVAGIGLFIVLLYLSGLFEGAKIKKAVFTVNGYLFPVFLLHHFIINAILERIPVSSIGGFGMLILFVLCMAVICMAGVGVRELERRLRNKKKYEDVYTAYISKGFLIAAAFIYLGRFVYLAWTQIPSFDGGMNLQVPVSIVKEGIYAARYDGIELFAGRIQTGVPVLLPIAFFFKIFGIGSPQGLMVNVLYIVLMYIFIYLICREMKANQTVVLLMMGITTLLWGFLRLSMGIYGEIPALALLLGTVYFLLIAERRKKKWHFVVAGMFYGLSYLTKTVILIAVPALMVVFASKWLIEKKVKIKDILLWGSGAVFPVAVFEIYKICQLGISGYASFWNSQGSNILKQAGVKEGYVDTVNLFEKIAVHLEIFSKNFNIQVGALIVILAFNFIWFACKVVRKKQLDYTDIIELIVYSYFGWWLLITPTEKAWGRRILIGVVLLEWISIMKFWQVFEWLLHREKALEYKNIKAAAETVVSIFAILFIIFGAGSYSTDSKKGSIELAEVVKQKVQEERAVICGYGWWQAPVISFYSGIDFRDLGNVKMDQTEDPVYFVADQAWLGESGETEGTLPYPVELVYEESYTGQKLYRVIK